MKSFTPPTKPSDDSLVLDPQNHSDIARRFLATHCQMSNTCTLLFYAGDFYRYNGKRHRKVEEDELIKEISVFLEKATKQVRHGGALINVPFGTTYRKCKDILNAIRGEIFVPNLQAPQWLEEDYVHAEARKIVPCRNVLYYPPTDEELFHIPDFFNLNVLNVEYQADAPEPKRWKQFLKEVWPDDPKSIDVLQEIFGYLITNDTSLQKVFFLIGAPGSGKGTICRVLTDLLGQWNIASTTFASIGSRFGLEPLVGKLVALFGDARLDKGYGVSQALERILSISGQDILGIDRKGVKMFSTRLNTRILITSNEVPHMPDASSALSRRMVALWTRQSFVGREDIELSEKLTKELPGILNWAITGLARLTKNKKFSTSKGGEEVKQDLIDVSSHVASFVRERCRVGGDQKVQKERLYQMYTAYCIAWGTQPEPARIFFRDLKAVCPGILATTVTTKGRSAPGFSGIGAKRGRMKKPT